MSIHERYAIPERDYALVFCESTGPGTDIPPAVPLQKRSLRAIPYGISPLCDDVTAGEAGPGIPVNRDQKKCIAVSGDPRRRHIHHYHRIFRIQRGCARQGAEVPENPPSGTAPLLESDAPVHPTAGTLPDTASLFPTGECRIIPGKLPRFPETLPHRHRLQR